jgi:DNA-binding NarL/FixJ family response regulator
MPRLAEAASTSLLGDELSSREQDVLELMAEGRTNQAIGKALFLAEPLRPTSTVFS